MKLGTFMMPLHPPEKDRTECFAEDVEFVVRADQLGFTEAWWANTTPSLGSRFRPTTSSSPTSYP